MPRIFSFGSNGSGQLGLGHREDISIPQEVELPVVEDECLIRTIISGGNHSAVLFSSGHVFASGDNVDGKCGLMEATKQVSVLTPVGFAIANGSFMDKFKFCSATWEATYLVVEDSSTYSCGTGYKGELGLGKSVCQAPSPQMLPDFPPNGTHVLQIASSMSHTVVVLSNGAVFGWGNGRKGQLGYPSELVWLPRKVKGIPFPASRAVCGRDFTLILGKSSEGCYVFFGLDKFSIQRCLAPLLPPWKNICATWSGIYLLLEDGRVLSFGRNDYKQLVPQGCEQFERIAAGSEHFLGKTIEGQLMARGWGEHGNCGERDECRSSVDNEWNFIHVTSNIVGLGAGCATSWIITE